MATSKTELANLALTRLGQSRILDISGGSENAILCNLLYPKARDEVLRSHNWCCAIERQSLAQSDYEIGDEYSYQYQLPADPYCLRVIGMPDNPIADYTIEGRQLLTNETSVIVKYIKRIENTSLFDSLLADAIVLNLALKLSYKIVLDLKVRVELGIEYMGVISEARLMNQIEKESSEQEDTSWIDAGR